MRKWWVGEVCFLVVDSLLWVRGFFFMFTFFQVRIKVLAQRVEWLIILLLTENWSVDQTFDNCYTFEAILFNFQGQIRQKGARQSENEVSWHKIGSVCLSYVYMSVYVMCKSKFLFSLVKGWTKQRPYLIFFGNISSQLTRSGRLSRS